MLTSNAPGHSDIIFHLQKKMKHFRAFGANQKATLAISVPCTPCAEALANQNCEVELPHTQSLLQ